MTAGAASAASACSDPRGRRRSSTTATYSSAKPRRPQTRSYAPASPASCRAAWSSTPPIAWSEDAPLFLRLVAVILVPAGGFGFLAAEIAAIGGPAVELRSLGVEDAAALDVGPDDNVLGRCFCAAVFEVGFLDLARLGRGGGQERGSEACARSNNFIFDAPLLSGQRQRSQCRAKPIRYDTATGGRCKQRESTGRREERTSAMERRRGQARRTSFTSCCAARGDAIRLCAGCRPSRADRPPARRSRGAVDRAHHRGGGGGAGRRRRSRRRAQRAADAVERRRHCINMLSLIKGGRFPFRR